MSVVVAVSEWILMQYTAEYLDCMNDYILDCVVVRREQGVINFILSKNLWNTVIGIFIATDRLFAPSHVFDSFQVWKVINFSIFLVL
jgi:hypothetical protein